MVAPDKNTQYYIALWQHFCDTNGVTRNMQIVKSQYSNAAQLKIVCVEVEKYFKVQIYIHYFVYLANKYFIF